MADMRWWQRLRSRLSLDALGRHRSLDLPGVPMPLPVPPPIVSLCEDFHCLGHALVLVGGSVRDLVLGRTPSSSWDLGTSATVYEVSRICVNVAWEDTSHTEFTLAYVTHGGYRLEITPFRKQHDYQWQRGKADPPVRHPWTLEQDLGGRDFTINAMAYDPLSGLLFDPYDGRRDLQLKRVRALPDAEARFRFDPVRVLRGLRIATKLDFEIDPGTWAAMQVDFDNESYDARRALMEFIRSLCGLRPAQALRRLRETGLLVRLCPDLEAVADEPDPLGPTRTILDRLSQALERLSPADPAEVVSALAAACVVRAVPPASAMAMRLDELSVAFDEQVLRLLAPIEEAGVGDSGMAYRDVAWWFAVVGCPRDSFEGALNGQQGWQSVWAPVEVEGWPRLADAWWSSRLEDESRASADAAAPPRD